MVSPSINHNLLYPLWNPFAVLLNNAFFSKAKQWQRQLIPALCPSNCQIVDASLIDLEFKQFVLLWPGNTVL